LYCARAGDDAPLNVWILERVAAWEAAGNVVPDWVDLAPAPLQSNGVQTL